MRHAAATLTALGLAALGLAALGMGCAGRYREPIPPPRAPLVATGPNAIPDPPPPGQSPRLSLEPFVRRTLANGLTVWLAPRPAASAVEVVFVSRGAATRDGRVFRGLTRLMARSLLRATMIDGRPHPDWLRNEGYAPDVSALPGGTVVRQRLLPASLDHYLSRRDLALRQPAFSESDLERVRADEADAIRSTRRTTATMIERWVAQKLYEEGDRRRRDPSGGLRAVERSTRRLIAFRHAQTFVPSESAIIVVGAFEPEPTLTAIEGAFGDWRGADEGPRLSAPRYGTPESRVLGIYGGSTQTHVSFYERAPARADADHAAFLVIERVLGGMFTARLNMDIREARGASYGFSARYAPTATEGELRLWTSVEPGAMGYVLGSVRRELERVRGEHGGVTALELNRARTLAREALLAELDTTDGLSAMLAQCFRAARGPEDVEQLVGRLETIGADEIHAAARRWIRPDRSPIVVIGDTHQVAVELRLAGLGGVELRHGLGRSRSY